MKNDSLYELTLSVVNQNESLYNFWESNISAFMAKRWKEGFKLTCEKTESENPTVMEVADFGRSEIVDQKAFIADLHEVFRTLAKGCQLDSSGEWC